MPSDDLAECEECPLTRLFGEFLPQVLQQNPLVWQKGGAPSDSFRMLHLHESGCEFAATTRRVATRQTTILPGASEKVDTFWNHGYRVCSVCYESYPVEPDAFGDGCMTYYLGIMAERMEGGDDE